MYTFSLDDLYPLVQARTLHATLKAGRLWTSRTTMKGSAKSEHKRLANDSDDNIDVSDGPC